MVPNGGPTDRATAALIQPNDNVDTRLIGQEGREQMGGGGSRGCFKTSGSFSPCVSHVVVDMGHLPAQATKSPERRESECLLTLDTILTEKRRSWYYIRHILLRLETLPLAEMRISPILVFRGAACTVLAAKQTPQSGGECVGENVRYAIGGGWEGVMAKRVVPLRLEEVACHARQTETQTWADTRGMRVNLAFWVRSLEN